MKIKHEEINKNLGFPFKIFYFKAQSLSKIISPHWHKSTEILFVIEGKIRVKVKDKDTILSKNHFIIINPNIIHSTQSLTKNYVICLQLPLNFLKNLTNGLFMEKFKFNATVNNFSKGKIHKVICTLDYNLTKTNQDVHTKLSVYENTILLLKILLADYTVKFTGKSINNIEFMNNFIYFIDKKYATTLKLEDVAEQFGYSIAYTSRLIKQCLGESFTSYLMGVRVEKAIDMYVNNNQESLENIAVKVGFSTYRNFYNATMKIYGLSPRKTINKVSQ
ncbi:AraC family transcriptional regulator [Ligilactobacillus agilis]|uniref:AraC family transcriptional regulator n=1 Tax=Ligilactobacillus agilis TaxID=1601 RepID=A0A6F9XT51_9LACO|nr:helix-turn-helix domain-containing protein [Ligilactobacillus agilis]GET08453.1 AraC family transcriptional regulator [Ligilactobacillus agilis]GET19331.1 AraC family transcriptional regulator [Ligilactobacillus agilis]